MERDQLPETFNSLLDDISLLPHRLRADFYLFTCIFFSTVYQGQKLADQPYLRLLCSRVARFCTTFGSRLIINLPPQHLKTFTASVCAAAWMLARDPATKIIVVCNSEALARDIARHILTILQSKLYCRAFPGTRLAYETVMDLRTTAGGGVFAVPITGKFTGRGADVIIVDDPLQIDDASNIKLIHAINSLFETVVRSRLSNQKTGRILVVMHRLHSDDLSGHLLRQGGWDHLKLALIAVEDSTYEGDL